MLQNASISSIERDQPTPRTAQGQHSRPRPIDPDLVPFEPPPGPLPLLPGLRTFVRNYIESFPRSTYEEPTTRIKRVISDVLFLCDPALIQELLVTRADEFGRDVMTRRAFAPMISETSLFLAEGVDWRWQRRAVAPQFRHEALLSYVPVFADKAARQVERWRAASRNAPVDVAAGMTRTTFEVIVEILLGGVAVSDADRFERALTTSFDAMVWQSLLALFSAPRWTPYPGRRRANQARDVIHQEMNRIVAKRRTQGSTQRDLLDLLLAARDSETDRTMTDTELTANLLTFVTAGHETTAVALAWTLWLVARDEAVQRRLFEEARAVVGDGAIDAPHIERLTFTRQVIQEAMRLYPPVPAIARQAHAPTQIGGHNVGTSTQIMVPIFTLHRHARVWEHPLVFDPERFAPDRAKARSRYAYLPFGAGPRVCIGASMATIEATVVLATLVRAFRFRTLPGHQPKPIVKLSLRPQGGMPLLLEPR